MTFEAFKDFVLRQVGKGRKTFLSVGLQEDIEQASQESDLFGQIPTVQQIDDWLLVWAKDSPREWESPEMLWECPVCGEVNSLLAVDLVENPDVQCLGLIPHGTDWANCTWIGTLNETDQDPGPFISFVYKGRPELPGDRTHWQACEPPRNRRVFWGRRVGGVVKFMGTFGEVGPPITWNPDTDYWAEMPLDPKES